MTPHAAASNRPEAAHAATQALALVPGGTCGRAVDAVVAGVLAIACKHGGALLGSGSFLLAGTGEGLLAIDGRARQPGLGAPRPRGFVDVGSVPQAARIATPLLPAALVVTHNGRGERTLTQLANLAIASARSHGGVDDERANSIAAFGREGAGVVRNGTLAEALIRTAARSLGGLLGPEDLEGARPEVAVGTQVDVDGRRWSLVPWAHRAHNALVGSDADATSVDGGPDVSVIGETAVVAAVDMWGGFALASLSLVPGGAPLEGTGLYAPPLAIPVMRGVARTPAGVAIPSLAPIAASGPRGSAVIDLALGVGGFGDADEIFVQLVRGVSSPGAQFAEVIGRARARRREGGAVLEEVPSSAFGVAAGVLRDDRGEARALVDARR
jgi:hypothetical protein